MSMAKSKLLAAEPAPSGEATLGRKPAGASKERRVSVWKDVVAGIVSNKASLASAIFILLLAAVALVTKFFPQVLPYDPYSQNLSESLLGPSAQHWFGTDIQGRDIFCRVLVGTQITLAVGLAAVAISLFAGVLLGSVAGYKGGKWDTVIMRVMDMMLSIPSILLAIAIMAALGPGIEKAVVAIGLVAIPEYARIVRSEILSIKENDYVAAARVIGDSNAKIVFIGPCTAKKMEFKYERAAEYIDCTLTFEELQALFDSRDIDLTTLPEGVLDNASYYGRIFARSGGLTDAVTEALQEQGNTDFKLNPIACDGIEACKTALLRASKNVLPNNFIEGMACVGGCIGGAGCLTHGDKNKSDVDKYGRQAMEKSIVDAISVTDVGPKATKVQP